MIQNSRSPVVKSRISSSSGRMMSVENRSFAWTWTMSSLLYLTTRAPGSAACRAPPQTAIAAKRSRPRNERFPLYENMLFVPPSKLGLLGIPVVKPARNGLHEEHDRGQHTG